MGVGEVPSRLLQLVNGQSRSDQPVCYLNAAKSLIRMGILALTLLI